METEVESDEALEYIKMNISHTEINLGKKELDRIPSTLSGLILLAQARGER